MLFIWTSKYMCDKFHMFHGHTVLRIASILDDLGLVLHFGNVQPLTIIEAFVCGLTFVVAQCPTKRLALFSPALKYTNT